MDVWHLYEYGRTTSVWVWTHHICMNVASVWIWTYDICMSMDASHLYECGRMTSVWIWTHTNIDWDVWHPYECGRMASLWIRTYMNTYIRRIEYSCIHCIYWRRYVCVVVATQRSRRCWSRLIESVQLCVSVLTCVLWWLHRDPGGVGADWLSQYSCVYQYWRVCCGGCTEIQAVFEPTDWVNTAVCIYGVNAFVFPFVICAMCALSMSVCVCDSAWSYLLCAI